MTLRRWILLALLSGLATAADRELAGKVVDADTGQPIARAHLTVRFFSAGQPSPEVTLLSDTDGTFRLTNMPNGGFQISCERAGYLPVNQGGGAVGTGRGDQSTPNMIVKMTAQAALEGTIVDENDIPAANTFVQLVHQQVLNGRRQLQIAQGGATDESGHFRLFGLSAGRYYVSILPHLTGAKRNRPVAYPQLYYPGALDLATAQPVDLKAGDEMQIKMQLPAPIAAFTVSGAVATGAPNVSVMLIREPMDQTIQQAIGEVNIDAKAKTFRIAHVPRGMYLLRATAMDSKNSSQASVPISVSGSDVTGVRLDPVDIALDGVVRADGTGQNQQRPGGFISLQSDHGGGGAQVDAEGRFHIGGLQPDTYRLAPGLYGGQQCIRSVLQSGRDVSDGITIAPGATPDPIEIVMSAHCGNVDVVLTPPDGPVTPNLTAYLLRKLKDEYQLEKQGFLMVGNGNNPNSHFMIQSVPAGDYVAFVWAQDQPIEYTNAEYMRQFESYGRPVTVSEDSTATVTIDKVLTLPKN